jgi:hypothetical protein
LIALRAVAWFTEASPKEQTTTASRGASGARSSRTAVPTALGRWLAMVEVWGGIHIAWLPKTLCRPPEAGSSAAATKERATAPTPSTPATLRARARKKPPER